MSVEFQGKDDSFMVSKSPKILYGSFQSGSKVPRIVRALIQAGIVKTELQANLLLIGFFIVAIVLSGILIVRTSEKSIIENSLAHPIKKSI